LSTLYIRLPSKATADNTQHWISLACPFALVSHGDAIEREGNAPIADLADAVAKAKRVILLLAASDVTLLRLQVPPLSAARLKAALPNLVEDQLVTDPTECAIIAGEEFQGLRTIAVVNKGWLEILRTTFATFGARNISALPSQLCLPYQSGIASAAIAAQNAEIDLCLRLSEQSGIGLPIMSEQTEAAAQEVVQTICTLVPQAPITLYVPQVEVRAYQDVIKRMLALEQRITVYADNWSRWLVGANSTKLNLMASNIGGGVKIEWKRWRWPIGLAIGTLFINIIGLNIDWFRMRHEADFLRASMMQTYRAAYPADKVIIDPIAQMNQKITAAQRAAGQTAPDDFTALAANFSEVWTSVTPATENNASPIASVEYRDRSLTVRLKPGINMPADVLKSALAARNLSLSQPSADIWQVRQMQPTRSEK